MSQKKYASPTTLQNLVDNIKALFVKKTDLETTLSGYDTKGSAAAVQTNLNTVSDKLDSHTTNSDIHVTTTNKSNWNSAYTHSTSAHARADATKVADSTTNGNILINGSETNVYSHPNSGVTAGTYKSVTVNAQGHITSGSNPTTLSGFGITDAETKSDATSKLAEAKTYADNAATKVKNDLLNGAGGAYDTLKELGDLIDDNKDAIQVLNDVAASKADKVHIHTTNDITNLQSELDKKVDDEYLFSAESTGDTIIWNGDTTGLTSTPDGTHYKLSDEAPTLDELADGLVFDGTEYTIENYDINELGSGILSVGYVADVVFVPESGVNVNINGKLFPEAGTYISLDAYENHDLVLTVRNYTKYPIIKKVKKSLLPEIELPDNLVKDADLSYFGASSQNIGKYNAVAYGNGKFVALPYRESSDSKFVYSTDGKSWTEIDAPASAYWKDIVYADGKFVAISSTSISSGYQGAVSTDGISWTATTIPSGGSPAQLTYGNGKFVLVGSNRATAWSTDGITWTKVSFPSSGYPMGIAYGNGKFIVPTSSGKYYYSTTGTSWSEGTMITANVSDIVFDGTKFVIVGRDNAMYSTDGANWTQVSVPASANYACLAYGGGIYVALGYHSNVAMYSYDGINWIGANVDVADNWGDIAYGNGVFVAGTEDGVNLLTITIGNEYGLAYKKDTEWTLIYDSGEITTAVNSIANINISGYKNIQVVAQNVNDGTNTTSAAGAIKFTSNGGNSYLFPAWANFFQTTSGKNTAGMAHFKVLNEWLMMEHSAASAAQDNDIFNETEGGSAFKCTVHSGSAFIRCTNGLSTMAITSNGQSTSNYLGAGSRVMVWGCNA